MKLESVELLSNLCRRSVKLLQLSGRASSPDESGVDVGAVNHGVTADARQNLSRAGINAVDRSSSDRAMALVAQLVDIGNVQQSSILRAMWRVASQATLPLDRGMFKHEGTACLRMALGTDGILIGGGLNVVVAKGPVDVMAIAALHQALIHLVMKGRGKCRLDIGMALIAEQRLRHLQ